MIGYELAELLERLEAHEIEQLRQRWSSNGVAVDELRAAMLDGERWRERWELLGPVGRSVVDAVRRREDRCLGYRELVDVSLNGHTQHELDEELERLCGEGILFRVEDRRVERCEEPALALPRDVATLLDGVVDAGEERDKAPTELVTTLKDFLERRHFQQQGQGENGRSAQHARQAYKLFLQSAAVRKRIARLPDDVRELVELAITRFGGLLPRGLHARTRGDDGAFERADLGQILEQNLCGTVGRLDLRSVGVDLAEETLVVFQEVCLVWLRANAQTQVPQPSDERVAGVDLATNTLRILRYVDDNSVRFTVKGEIFQATRKRLLRQLVVRGEEDVERLFDFLYRFALSRRLLERTGERTLRLSEAGRAFERKEIADKSKELLAFAVEDPSCGGDPFHQVKLRRILLRLLRRLDAGVWYDAMYAPFLARNSYLGQLGEQGAREHYDNKRANGRHVLLEDLPKLAWHLFAWVRERLHPLGIVDLGYDGKQPSALRLSSLGASLLADSPAQAAEGSRSTLVVNPDFEILLFPDSDAHELVHTLDRFAKRVSSDRLYRFELSRESVRSALADGMGIVEILEVLQTRCRAALPQNVLFSLRDWGAQAGAVRLESGRVLRAARAETLDKLAAHPRVRELTERGEELVLRPEVRVEDFRELLLDLGFCLVEAGEGADS